MKILTPRQKQRIRQIVRDRHLALLVSLCGPDVIPKSDYERLNAAGMIKLPAKPLDLVTAAHMLGGQLSSQQLTSGPAVTPVEFWKTAPKVESVDDAIDIAKDKLTEHVIGMGGKFEHALLTEIAATRDTQRKKYLTSGERKKLSQKLRDHASVKQIAQAMEKLSNDVKRDWLRLAHTEVHNTMEEGKAVALIKLGHGDVLVYKKPRPDACPYCKLLYLKPDGTPRIFKLSELLANGSNVGRKAGRPQKGKTGWKATLGAMHPWCGCGLHYLPAGHGLDAKGNVVQMKKSMIQIDTLSNAHARHVCTHD